MWMRDRDVLIQKLYGTGTPRQMRAGYAALGPRRTPSEDADATAMWRGWLAKPMQRAQCVECQSANVWWTDAGLPNRPPMATQLELARLCLNGPGYGYPLLTCLIQHSVVQGIVCVSPPILDLLAEYKPSDRANVQQIMDASRPKCIAAECPMSRRDQREKPDQVMAWFHGWFAPVVRQVLARPVGPQSHHMLVLLLYMLSEGAWMDYSVEIIRAPWLWQAYGVAPLS
jgi:hypothetical protein